MNEFLHHLWMASLVLGLSIALVAVLRVPWRRLFGAEQACLLWWLPPLGLIASQLPNAEASALAARMPTVFRFTAEAATSTLSPIAISAQGSSILPWAWICGVALCLILAGWRQWQLLARLRPLRPLADRLDPPLWSTANRSAGPALVGLWRPRILVPEDFEQRHDARERQLISRAFEIGKAEQCRSKFRFQGRVSVQLLQAVRQPACLLKVV